MIIIDDNISDSNEIKRLLSGFGADVFQALRIGYAKEYLTKFKTADIVICDFKLADGNVVELIEWLDHKNIGCSVFIITDVETVADAAVPEQRIISTGVLSANCLCRKSDLNR